MSDPNRIVAGIDDAEDAFEYVTRGTPDFETGISQGEEWKTQLTKGCRYLESTRMLRSQDGFNGAVVELSFGAIERTLEAYLLWDTADDLSQFHDHETVYDRAAERGLFERETARRLKELYGRNRTEHYYGGSVPTQQEADAMFELATDVHDFVADQIRVGGVCTCP